MNEEFGKHYNAVLEAYSQTRYDFDPEALNPQEIKQIKLLAKEKRMDYGISPIGPEIFRYLYEKEGNLFFESEKFENQELDAILYMPTYMNDYVSI